MCLLLSQSNTTGGEAEVGVDLQMPFPCLIPPSNFQKICMGCKFVVFSKSREVIKDFASASGQIEAGEDPNKRFSAF